jgi:hypothetical protein
MGSLRYMPRQHLASGVAIDAWIKVIEQHSKEQKTVKHKNEAQITQPQTTRGNKAAHGGGIGPRREWLWQGKPRPAKRAQPGYYNVGYATSTIRATAESYKQQVIPAVEKQSEIRPL